MDIWLDTAKKSEVLKAEGLIIKPKGFTTNPTLWLEGYNERISSGEDISFIESVIDFVTYAAPRLVSLQIATKDREDAVRKGLAAYENFIQFGNPLIKVPIILNPFEPDIEDSLYAIEKLKENGIPINVTNIQDPEQALLAAKAGADYASFFVGRIDDLLSDLAGIEKKKEDYFIVSGPTVSGEFSRAQERLEKIAGTYEGLKYVDGRLELFGIVSGSHGMKAIDDLFRGDKIFKTKKLAASIRNLAQLEEVERYSDVATVPLYVLEAWNKKHANDDELLPKTIFRGYKHDNREIRLVHPKTIEGVRKFLDDAEKVPQYQEIFEPFEAKVRVQV